jgi:hypothetical protein
MNKIYKILEKSDPVMTFLISIILVVILIVFLNKQFRENFTITPSKVKDNMNTLLSNLSLNIKTFTDDSVVFKKMSDVDNITTNSLNANELTTDSLTVSEKLISDTANITTDTTTDVLATNSLDVNGIILSEREMSALDVKNDIGGYVIRKDKKGIFLKEGTHSVYESDEQNYKYLNYDWEVIVLFKGYSFKSGSTTVNSKNISQYIAINNPENIDDTYTLSFDKSVYNSEASLDIDFVLPPSEYNLY